jgi:hypothetical protein
MATWGRRKKSDDPPPPTLESRTQELDLWNDEDGILVSGSADAVRDLVARLGEVGGSQLTTSPVAPADALAVFATGYADGASTMQYVRHTPHSAALLQEFGAIPNGAGGYRSFVRNATGIEGNLDWELMSAGPERALAFQTAAVGLALRTAVRNVELAVERVEDKLDQVIALLRAERLGSVLGDRRTLDGLIAHLDAGDPLTSADWSSVATLGPAITRDLEKLRAYLRTQLEEVDGSWRPRQRANAAGRLLAEGMLSETLALLVVGEHNFSQWQHLRLHRIANDEPARLEAAVRQAKVAMHDHLAEDQQLLEQFHQSQATILDPLALDGLAPLQTRALRRAENELDQLTNWFAEQRLLDFEPASPRARPGLRSSIGSIVESGLDRVPRRRSDNAQPELPLPDDSPAQPESSAGAHGGDDGA